MLNIVRYLPASSVISNEKKKNNSAQACELGVYTYTVRFRRYIVRREKFLFNFAGILFIIRILRKTAEEIGKSRIAKYASVRYYFRNASSQKRL